MRAPTKRQRQWIWFAVLWCSGLSAAFLLSFLVRWVLSIG